MKRIMLTVRVDYALV